MSAAIRTALADAANAVLGVGRCSGYFRQSTRVGDAWVSFARRDRDESGFAFMDSWEIRVVLSQDLETAEKWIDAHADALAEALNPQLIVTALVPTMLTLDTGNVPALIIEGVRPH